MNSNAPKSAVTLIGSSYLLIFWTNSNLYLIGVTVLNSILIWAGYRLYNSESNKAGWLLFKLTSPYILLVFLLFMFSYL